MRLAVLLALLALFAAAPALAQTQTTLYPGQSGAPLRSAIEADYAPAQTLGYNAARDVLYQREQDTYGQVCGVYTRFCITLTPGADPSTDAYNQGVNAEHTWPQSLGASAEPAKSDLHHLFPAKANVNSSRSNHPYAEIPDAQADGWYRGADAQSNTPSVFVDQWSEKDNSHPDPAFSGRFEPRHDHKGDAARAVFYVAAVYDGPVQAAGAQPFFDVQKDDLIVWHYADPASAAEYARSQWVASIQGTHNPFVLDSTLARRAFGLSGTGGGGGTPPAALWVNELHYDNAGADSGEGVEIAGPAGTSLSGWSLALYNGSNGSVYGTVALSGALPDQSGGYGTVWVPVSGLQNGAPDGLALLAPDGSVAQFLSYEGALTATAGPAAGATAQDIGVAETSSTPAGHSLALTGGGAGRTAASDFAWAPPAPASPGMPNPGQALGAPAQPVAWINEIHYDNAGSDRDEGVEIAGTAGLDLSGWSVALYNGSNGSVYGTLALSGAIDDEGAGLGARWFSRSGLQNGAPDGLALLDASGAVVEFLSYEGALTATGGPAAGLTATDLGVAESGGTARGRSLQRTGSGSTAADFTWAAPQGHTRGRVNRGQTFGSAKTLASTSAPARAALDLAVYPNPVRARATLSVRLDAPAPARISVYDALGRRVLATRVDLDAGLHALPLGLSAAAPGLYVVHLATPDATSTHTLTVVR